MQNDQLQVIAYILLLEIIVIHVNSSHITFFYMYLIKQKKSIKLYKLLVSLFCRTYMLNCYDTQRVGKTNKGHRVAAKKNVSIVIVRFLLMHFFSYYMYISIGKTLDICKGDYSAT